MGLRLYICDHHPIAWTGDSLHLLDVLVCPHVLYSIHVRKLAGLENWGIMRANVHQHIVLNGSIQCVVIHTIFWYCYQASRYTQNIT